MPYSGSIVAEREILDRVPQILNAITASGGDRWEWVCDTSSDADEAIAREKGNMFGDPLVWTFPNYEAAVRVKRILGAAGLDAPPEKRTRGGHQLYCYRRRWCRMS